MKLYELKFQVRHGEMEFYFVELFNAENDKEANRKAHVWCRDFYEEGEILDENSYEFCCGDLIITIKSVREIDKEEWKEEQYNEKFKDIKEIDWQNS